MPEHSMRPSGCTKGLIFGLLSTYYHQNTNINDFKQVASLLHQHLIDRGYKRDQVNETFIEASQKLDR